MTQSIVTFPQLGMHGRFGNQLFQIAATLAHARHVGCEVRFRWEAWNPLYLHLGILARWFSLEEEVGPPYFAGWNYEPIPDHARALYGYYQSPKFWGGECPLRVVGAVGKERVVAHFRGGDYRVLQDFHPVLPVSYYQEALRIERVSRGAMVSEEAVNIPGFQWGGRFSLWTDFRRMLSAEVLVISNSTLALWAAYLGRAKTIYYPQPWFGPELLAHDETQLIPEVSEKVWIGIPYKDITMTFDTTRWSERWEVKSR